MTDLVRKGFSAFKWGAVSSVARFGLQIVAQSIMARALGPEVYGIFGMALVVLTFANFCAEFGFGWSIIYRENLGPDDVRFAFTCQLISGTLVAAALFFGAGLVADYFQEPRVLPVVQWISVTCIFAALTAPSTSLLARDMRFKESGLVQVASYFVGYVVVGIPMALTGQGVAALVASWVTMSVTRLVGSYALTRHSIRPLLRHPQARSFLVSGNTVFFTNLTNWLLNNLDRMLVGRFLNASAMGFYTVGANLANTPNGLLLSALQPAFLSAGAKMGGNSPELRQAYRRVVGAALALVVPVYATLAALAPGIVATLYNDRWTNAAPVLAILLLAMPAFIVWGVSTPILWNTGRASHEALLQWPVLLLGAVALLLLAPHGIVVVASITATILLLRALLMCAWVCRALGLRLSVFGPDLLRGLALGALCGLAAAASLQPALKVMPAVLALLLASAAAILVGAVVVRSRPGVVGDSGAAVLLRMSPRLARALRVRAADACASAGPTPHA